jgi:hypothetical protein
MLSAAMTESIIAIHVQIGTSRHDMTGLLL